MEINININENGTIVCDSKVGSKSKYFGFSKIKKDIIRSLNSLKKVDIIDGKIYLEFEKFNLNIKNYQNNINKDLDLIIKRAKSIKVKETKNKLRKQKIKRIAAFTGAVILTASSIKIITDEKKDIKIEDHKQNITYMNYDKNTNEDNFIIDEYNYVNEFDDNKLTYNLEFESRIETDKYKIAKAYYYDFIKKISPEYGIDPQIILAIATQESGMHDKNENGPAMGLMQIELGVWDNQSITAFNYSKNQYETYNITKEKLKDLEFNVRVGCMIFQDCLKKSNNNLLVAIQMYNFGYGNISTVLKNYYSTNNINMNEAIKNLNDDWINSRSVINEGDKLYLEHVLSYIEDLDNIQCINHNNNKTIHYGIDKDNVRNLTM